MTSKYYGVIDSDFFFRWVGGVAARISEISFTKNPESEFFIKKKKNLAGGRGGDGCG